MFASATNSLLYTEGSTKEQWLVRDVFLEISVFQGNLLECKQFLQFPVGILELLATAVSFLLALLLVVSGRGHTLK
jgi:hypothetical protein